MLLGNPLNSGVTLSSGCCSHGPQLQLQQLKEQQGEVPKSLGGKFLQHSWIMEGIIFGVSKGLLANLLLQTSIVYIFFPNNRGFKRAVNLSNIATNHQKVLPSKMD